MEKSKVNCPECYQFLGDEISDKIAGKINENLLKTIQPLVLRVDNVEKQIDKIFFWLISLTVFIAFIIVALFLLLRTIKP